MKELRTWSLALLSSAGVGGSVLRRSISARSALVAATVVALFVAADAAERRRPLARVGVAEFFDEQRPQRLFLALASETERFEISAVRAVPAPRDVNERFRRVGVLCAAQCESNFRTHFGVRIRF